jgi:hypothetical protein
MAFGRRRNPGGGLPNGESLNPAAKQRRAHWIRGALMALGVAIGNVIYFAYTGESLPSPNYGAAARRGHEPNPGGAILLTAVMLIFAGFCLVMQRRQKRKEQQPKNRS